MEAKRPEDPMAKEKIRLVRATRVALRNKAEAARLPWRRKAYERLAGSTRLRTFVSAIHRNSKRGIRPEEIEDLVKRFAIKAATKRRKRYSVKLKFGEGHSLLVKSSPRGVSTELTMREAQLFYR